MTVEEIKKAVDRGQPVNWSNPFYNVIKDKLGQYFIKCISNNHLIGLTHMDEVTLNGKEEDFFIAGLKEEKVIFGDYESAIRKKKGDWEILEANVPGCVMTLFLITKNKVVQSWQTELEYAIESFDSLTG